MRAFLVLLCAGLVAGTVPGAAQTAPPFSVVEASIADIHAALRAGRLTCRGLVEHYLRRIEAYDKNGPAVNAIVLVNPRALAEADGLDALAGKGGPLGPLHCVPTIVKDNFETVGLQTSNGSLTFEGYVPATDAFQVARIKAAGAIVLAKSNLAEWAFTPNETLSSILPGYTKNPYALDRVTAGSSGGTAAAVAASFGAVGLGSDTGNSIRGPSSHQALVGIRSTMGLTSRAGVFPLSLLADIAGPMARTVADAVAVFQVVAGEDANDAATAASRGRTIPRYADALQADALRGHARRGAAAGLRARHHRSGDRAGVHGGGGGPAPRRGDHRRSGHGRRARRDPTRPRDGRLPGLQARHQRVPGRAQGPRAGGRPGGDRQGRQVPSHGAASAGAGGAGPGQRAGHAGMPGRGGVPRAGAGGGARG